MTHFIFQCVDAGNSLAGTRQKVLTKMGTLRKLDPRTTRSKVSGPDGKHKHDELGLNDRVTKIEAVLPTLATKEDLAREVGTVRSEMHQGFGELRGEMHREFGEVRREFASEIADVRRDVHAMGANLHLEMHRQTWRLIGTIVTVSTALVAATHFLSRAG